MNNEHIELKFKLGSQLENWEFDLSALREYIQDGICCEVYEYVGSDKSFLDIEPDRIELSFNADILVKVEYYFKLELYAELLFKLEQKLGKPAESDRLSASWYLFDLHLSIRMVNECKTYSLVINN